MVTNDGFFIALYVVVLPSIVLATPTLVIAFFSIAPKISILANMVRVSIYSFYDPTWQQLFFFVALLL
jgi:NADH-ubiquinone oxidoreductase chain 2